MQSNSNIRNRRVNPHSRIRGYSTNAAINMHFENINMLANIIQNSQCLLEQQYQSNTSEQNRISHMYTRDNLTPFFDNIGYYFSTTFHDTNTTDVSNLNIMCINTSNINQYTDSLNNASNAAQVYDFQYFRDVPNPINRTCPIMHEDFTPEQNVMVIRRCRHVFDKYHLSIWIRTRNTCPYCRVNIFDY